MRKQAEQGGWGYCTATQDSFLHAWLYVSRYREIVQIIKVRKAHWDVGFADEALLCQQYGTCSALVVVVLFLSFPAMGMALGPPFRRARRQADTDRGAAPSICCGRCLGPGPKLGPCRERGWLAPQLLPISSSALPEGLFLLVFGVFTPQLSAGKWIRTV